MHNFLNPDQQFLIAHSTRSYYGCTQLLEIDGGGGPYWIVNEGEYCMMNTLDLSVDHMFWELKQNPWVIKNLLDNFVKHYSYHDQVKLPPTSTQDSALSTQRPALPSPPEGHLLRPRPRRPQPILPPRHQQLRTPQPHRLLQLHDPGTTLQLDPHRRLVTLQRTSDIDLKALKETMPKFFASASTLCATVLPLALCNTTLLCVVLEFGEGSGQFYGFISLRFSRHTSPHRTSTYDSLVKCWAAYEGLALLFRALEIRVESEQDQHSASWDKATEAAMNTARCLAQLGRDHEILPAVFWESSAASAARILPAIEALVYLMYWEQVRDKSIFPDDLNPFPVRFLNHGYSPGHAVANMHAALRTDNITLLSDQENRNKFSDNGIRLSSTSDNSWASKIAIIQHVARRLFNLNENGQERPPSSSPNAGWEASDAAHTRWQTNPTSAYWACSDQIINGTAKGSKYYPRIITTTLWLD